MLFFLAVDAPAVLTLANIVCQWRDILLPAANQEQQLAAANYTDLKQTPTEFGPIFLSSTVNALILKSSFGFKNNFGLNQLIFTLRPEFSLIAGTDSWSSWNKQLRAYHFGLLLHFCQRLVPPWQKVCLFCQLFWGQNMSVFHLSIQSPQNMPSAVLFLSINVNYCVTETILMLPPRSQLVHLHVYSHLLPSVGYNVPTNGTKKKDYPTSIPCGVYKSQSTGWNVRELTAKLPCVSRPKNELHNKSCWRTESLILLCVAALMLRASPLTGSSLASPCNIRMACPLVSGLWNL